MPASRDILIGLACITCAPLTDIPMHVEEPPRIGFLRSDGMSHILTITYEPDMLIEGVE